MEKTRSVSALNWIYKYTKKQLWWVVFLAVLSGAISLGFILLAVVSKNILDIATGDVEGNILIPTIIIVLIIIAQGVFNILYSNIYVRAYNKIDMRIKDNLFKLVLNKKWSEINKYHSGELLNRFTNDVDVVVTGVISIIPSAISFGTRLLAGLVVLIFIDARFTLIIMVLGIIVALAGKLYSKRFKYLHKLFQKSDGRVRAYIQECIENIIVIKSFANDEVCGEKLKERQFAKFDVALKKNMVSNIANTGVYVFFTAGYYAALLWGAMQIAKGALTFGTLTAFLQIIDMIKAPMKNMSGLIPQFYSMVASAERIIEIESIEDEEGVPIQTSTEEIYNAMESLCLENVSFSYHDELVLENATININKGEITAIAGPSGIGKSTLMKLVLGLLSVDEGKLYLKTVNGEISIDSGLRRLFAYVPQGNMILSGSIRENISFCNPQASIEDVILAAKNAKIWDFINTLPEGIETQVGERGLGLSEGQVQRIAIARAFLSDAPVLLFDEATSALDEATEKALLQNIKAMKNKTCIFISHKEKTISQCDQIYYMNNHKFDKVNFEELIEMWK